MVCGFHSFFSVTAGGNRYIISENLGALFSHVTERQNDTYHEFLFLVLCMHSYEDICLCCCYDYVHNGQAEKFA